MELFDEDGVTLVINPDELLQVGNKDQNENFVKKIDERHEITRKRIGFTRFKSFGSCNWELRFKNRGGPVYKISQPEEKDLGRRIKMISFI